MTANLLAADPLFANGVDLTAFLIVAVKTVVVFAVLMISVLFMVWFERKVISDMQARIGPNRAGRWGLLQSLADGIKLFFKEDLVPERADRAVFKLAPYLAMVPAFLAFAIVPVGGTVEIAGRETYLQLADPPIGILLFLALSSIAVYGVMLAGWSSGSKYPLLGSVRASAQMVSYEAALGLSIAAVVLVTGTLSTREIVDWQLDNPWPVFALGFIPFVVFAIAGTAELNRPPFDLVEAEQELVGGFHTEYSSIRFALFYLAEFMNTVTMSAIIVTLFLGGPNGWEIGPIARQSPVWLLAKVFVFLFAFVWLRATLPRFRYDQLMDLGWKKLIPLSLGWLLVLAGMYVRPLYGVLVAVGATVAAVALARAVELGKRASAAEESPRAALREVR